MTARFLCGIVAVFVFVQQKFLKKKNFEDLIDHHFFKYCNNFYEGKILQSSGKQLSSKISIHYIEHCTRNTRANNYSQTCTAATE